MKPRTGYLKLYFAICVLFAMIGFITIFWFILNTWDEEAVESIKWLWQINGQNGDQGVANAQNQQLVLQYESLDVFKI